MRTGSDFIKHKYNKILRLHSKKIKSSPFSRVYLTNESSNSNLYFKFFNYPSKYLLNGEDLSPLFKRDRFNISVFLYRTYLRNGSLKKYLPKMFAFKKEEVIVTKNKKNVISLDQILINKDLDMDWLGKLMQITSDFISKKIICKEYKFLNNYNVCQLKIELEITKPLLHIFSKKKVIAIVKHLGRNHYLNHGDLQPKNIMVADNYLKIIDYEEAFIGPVGWDVGFLWGNSMCYCVKDHKKFQRILEAWFSLVNSKMTESIRFNVVAISIASILFRIYSFPIVIFTNEEKERLLFSILKMKDCLEI